MSTLAQPFQKLAVNSYALLALYAVIPFSILLVIVDVLFLHGSVKNYLPANPSALMFWAIIFNFPHIVSSMVTLADAEYIAFYKARFTKALSIIVLAVLSINVFIPALFPGQLSMLVSVVFFVFFSSYTMYHVLSQQFGIGMMLMKVRPDKQYEAWRWLATFATSIMYAMVFVEWSDKPFLETPYTLYQYLSVAAGAFTLLAVLQGLSLTRASQRQLGVWYVYSNLLMMLVSYVLLMMGYKFFVIAIPRFVHDITAFIIYSTHDYNRNTEQKKNIIYRFLQFIPVPIWVLCPILAIVLAHSIQCGSFVADLFLGFGDTAKAFNECPAVGYFDTTPASNGLPSNMQLWAQVMFICGLFHYHIEAFVWKREAIHRHSVSFS